jgi:hypothetical protein
VADRKNSSGEIRAQLAKGIFEMYSSAYNLANESLKKIIEEPYRYLLNNKRYYYLAQACIRMKDFTETSFKKTGEGYGTMIAYMNLALQSINVGYKDIVS